jgi:hypothetical protein
MWTEEAVCSKWLNINEDLAYKKIINTNITELKILENIYSKLDARTEI